MEPLTAQMPDSTLVVLCLIPLVYFVWGAIKILKNS